MDVATSTVFLDIELDDPDEEAALLDWWRAAHALLARRAHLLHARIAVLGRGRYRGELDFPLPGGWILIERDKAWRDLQTARPAGRIASQPARVWRRMGNPADLTTVELRHWIRERDAGRRDFALLDVLGPESYADRHLPGALCLPQREIDEESAARVIGSPNRAVVVYCSSYG